MQRTRNPQLITVQYFCFFPIKNLQPCILSSLLPWKKTCEVDSSVTRSRMFSSHLRQYPHNHCLPLLCQIPQRNLFHLKISNQLKEIKPPAVKEASPKSTLHFVGLVSFLSTTDISPHWCLNAIKLLPVRLRMLNNRPFLSSIYLTCPQLLTRSKHNGNERDSGAWLPGFKSWWHH